MFTFHSVIFSAGTNFFGLVGFSITFHAIPFDATVAICICIIFIKCCLVADSPFSVEIDPFRFLEGPRLGLNSILNTVDFFLFAMIQLQKFRFCCNFYNS